MSGTVTDDAAAEAAPDFESVSPSEFDATESKPELWRWFTAILLPPFAIKPAWERTSSPGRAWLVLALSCWAVYLFLWICPNLVGLTPGVYCWWSLLLASGGACYITVSSTLFGPNGDGFGRPAVITSGTCLAAVILLIQAYTREYLVSGWIEVPLPPARPQVLEHRLDSRVFGDNILNVKVENAGQAGWVVISNVAGRSVDKIEYEPGAVTWFRNTFTTDPSLGFDVKSRWRQTGRWEVCTWIGAGETKWVSFELPGHSSSSTDSPKATAVHTVPEGALLK